MFALGLTALTLVFMSYPTDTAYALFGSSVRDLPTQESTGYKVEARGYDLRVYECQLAAQPEVTCVAVFAESGPVGLQCLN